MSADDGKKKFNDALNNIFNTVNKAIDKAADGIARFMEEGNTPPPPSASRPATGTPKPSGVAKQPPKKPGSSRHFKF